MQKRAQKAAARATASKQRAAARALCEQKQAAKRVAAALKSSLKKAAAARAAHTGGAESADKKAAGGEVSAANDYAAKSRNRVFAGAKNEKKSLARAPKTAAHQAAQAAAEEAYKRQKKIVREQEHALGRLHAALGKANLRWDKFAERLAAIYPDFCEHLCIESCQVAGLDAELTPEGTVFARSRARKLAEQKFCVVDIEANDRAAGGQILEIGAVMVRGGQVLGEFSRLCHARGVSPAITALTGIDDAMLARAPRLEAVLFEFREFIGEAVFVAHGAFFDHSMIARESWRLLRIPLLNRKLCTLALARKFWPVEGGHSLANLREILSISGPAHRALDDARAAAAVLARIITLLPQSHQRNLESLLEQ